MKVLLVSVFLACLVFPIFPQDAMLRSLSDTIGSTISMGNETLSSLDQMMNDNANAKAFATYRARYESITRAMQESEFRLNRLIQSNSRIAVIREERDKYENFIIQLESIKSEYDDWLGSIR